METLPRKLLLVSRLPRNLQLLADLLRKEGYEIVGASSYEELDQVLEQASSISGCLLDIAGFDSDIWPRCEQLRSASIPFLIFSPRQSAAIQEASLSHGARGVMVKPLVTKELIRLVQSILS